MCRPLYYCYKYTAWFGDKDQSDAPQTLLLCYYFKIILASILLGLISGLRSTNFLSLTGR